MAVCYQCQLPVLPLDRPVPKHVLSRRGAISFSSSSSLFGCANPRLLSQTFTNSSNLWIPSSAWGECFLERRGAISYDSSDQAALYIRMLGDVRVRSRACFEPERRGSHLYIDFHLLHLPPESEGTTSVRKIKRLLSFQRYFHTQRFCRVISSQNFLSIIDIDCSGQAKCMLEKVGTWKFDIFRFHQMTNGNSLVALTFYLFKLHGLIEYFHLDVVKLRRFLVMVQEDYHQNNPYHNEVHAADVTQAMHCYLMEPEFAKSLSPWDILISLLAAATHDVDHPGVNQPFLIKTRHYLACLYKNTSVLENHHWRSAVCMLQETQLFSHLPVEDNFLIERQLGSLILATDINRQIEFLTKFRIHLDGEGVTLVDAGHRHFMLQIALKCADICNPCRAWELSKQWGERVSEEFFHQGDVEMLHKLDVSQLCDRRIATVAKIQVDFITYVVEPLFAEWSRFSNTILSQTMLGHLRLNKATWKEILHPQATGGNVTDATYGKTN